MAWGLSAVDLLCVAAGAVAGWWLYLALPGPIVLRAALGIAALLVGAGLGTIRIGDLALRRWIAIGLAYLVRPRTLVVIGGC